MKRKIAILLAAVMTTAMIPMNVMAASSNSVNKTITVATDELVEGVFLKIQPSDVITSTDTIAITVEGGEFLSTEDYTKFDKKAVDYNYENISGNEYSWNTAMQEYWKYCTKLNEENKVVLNTAGYSQVYNTVMAETAQLPYELTRNTSKEMQVKLFPVPVEYIGTEVGAAKTKYHYYIPLPIKATTTGDLKIKVDSNETTITGGGTYNIGSVTNSSGSTTMSIDEVKSFEDTGSIKDITIKENVKNTFKAGETVRLRLNGGFNFKANSTFTVEAGLNANFAKVSVTTGVEDSEVSFQLPANLGARDKAVAIKLIGIQVVADDEDDDWGDVNLTVSGAGTSRETIKVAERAQFNFKLTALEEPTTLIAGRFELASKEIEDVDCVAAEVKFEETITNSWITDRKLEFSVPEGVKIYDVEFDEVEKIGSYITKGKANLGSTEAAGEGLSITNDGRTLKIDKGIVVDKSDVSSFEMKLYLSADANFKGEVKLSVVGAGISEGDVEDVVIANVVTPIQIETTETKTNMGYQSVKAADVTITEVQEGIFLKGEKVEIALDASYGTDEVGFADEDIKVTAEGGELEIKNVKISGGVISFTVDKASYSKPASISIKNVTVGTTRSVPYGSYDLKVSGLGLINNYDEKKTDDKEAGYFDTTDSYSFKNYVTIGTVTGTLDAVVKVTIGEKTILVDDQAYDMDVAPYIQASSNSTMVPLRFVSVSLGVDSENVSNPDDSSKISYNANTKTATIFYGSGSGQKLIQFQAGSNLMVVDGTSIPMEYGVTAEIKDGRMFVPFRALGQALGVNVNWDADTRTATYNAK